MDNTMYCLIYCLNIILLTEDLTYKIGKVELSNRKT